MYKKKIQSMLMLLIATVIWGSAFVAQSVGNVIGPFSFQAIRSYLAVLVLIPVVFLFDKAQGRSFAKEWTNKKLWKTGILCGLTLFVACSTQQVGLVYTDAGKAGFITAMYIVLVPVCGLALGKKPPLSAINVGDILMICCALAFAVQITLVDCMAGDLDGIRLNIIQAFVCGTISLPFMIAEAPPLPAILDNWQSLCFAGVLSMGIAYTLQILAQKNLEPTPASLIMSLESVFGGLAAWLILHEIMTPSELTGSVLVFVAVIVSQIPARNKK